MQDTWLTWAQCLEAIAATGEFFGESDFDVERYQEVRSIALAMMAELANRPVEAIAELLPAPGQNYVTPQIDVRGVVFHDDQVLMVQEKSDGKWTLPGGYADVGLSAAENVVKEIREEAGIETEAVKLFAVRHKAKHPYRPDLRDFYKFYFLCGSLGDEVNPQVGLETSDVGFFPLDQLPDLSTGRTIQQDIELAWLYRQDVNKPTTFD